MSKKKNGKSSQGDKYSNDIENEYLEYLEEEKEDTAKAASKAERSKKEEKEKAKEQALMKAQEAFLNRPIGGGGSAPVTPRPPSTPKLEAVKPSLKPIKKVITASPSSLPDEVRITTHKKQMAAVKPIQGGEEFKKEPKKKIEAVIAPIEAPKQVEPKLDTPQKIADTPLSNLSTLVNEHKAIEKDPMKIPSKHEIEAKKEEGSEKDKQVKTTFLKKLAANTINKITQILSLFEKRKD